MRLHQKKIYMTIAIMQPYLFPYIGYFQLIHAVDRFIIYDDVCYINKGWINRNNILLNGAAHLFTIPLQDASQNKRICDIPLSADTKWRTKLLRLIDSAYHKAPCFGKAYPLIENLIQKQYDSIAGLNYYSIKIIT